jgi:hypothetical protein
MKVIACCDFPVAMVATSSSEEKSIVLCFLLHRCKLMALADLSASSSSKNMASVQPHFRNR